MTFVGHTLAAVIVTFSLIDTARADVVLDQSNYVPGASINTYNGTSALVWQQGVVAGVGGQLAEIHLFAELDPENIADNSATVFITLGKPWQTNAPKFTKLVEFTGTSSGWTAIDVRSAGITLYPGQAFVIGFQGQDSTQWPTLLGTSLDGYGPGQLFVNGAAIGEANSDFAFKTFVDTAVSVIGPQTARDFDTDGKTDISVFRPETGTWYVLNSSSNFSTYSTYQWGALGDVPVTGDYDGDGNLDLAVFRPSNGVWYILKSSTNYSTAISYQWGVPGDIAVSGDFDGDGKADIVVFRPSDATWWILKSSANFTAAAVYHWGSGSDVPLK
jgi:hypothetical protein